MVSGDDTCSVARSEQQLVADQTLDGTPSLDNLSVPGHFPLRFTAVKKRISFVYLTFSIFER